MRNNACKRVTTDLEVVELQSSCYWPDKNFLDGSRISREAIKTNSRKFQWIENAMRSIEKRSPKVLIDTYLSRSVKKLLSLIKIGFSKRGKTYRN